MIVSIRRLEKALAQGTEARSLMKETQSSLHVGVIQGQRTTRQPPLRGNFRPAFKCTRQKKKRKKEKNLYNEKETARAVVTAADIASSRLHYSELELEVELELSEGARGSSDTGDAGA